jgi:catechol 2,3-dioxygenase-like lactoylglutathione lyase family enzyme
MVKGLWNYAIKVADMEQAIAFYIESLGAEVRNRSEVLGQRYTLLRLGETRVILFEKAPYEDLIGETLPTGFLHDVYEVDDFDEQIRRLRAMGVRFIMEPQLIEADFGRRRIAFFETPDGMRTEVMQILEDRALP